jgi:hypothetical protein
MASKDARKSVMGNLPSTRPARIGGRRERANGDTAANEKPAAKPKATAAKAQPKAAAAKPKAAAAKPATTGATPKPKPAGSKPRAVRSGSPALKAAKDKKAASAPPRKQQPASPPKGTELVTTAVQAAGELAQIGLTLGGQAVKRAVRRLPKP